MKTLFIVLNYNGVSDTLRCLGSLEKQTYKNYKILLIDNGSTDDSSKILSRIKQKNLIFQHEQKNSGFTGGVNIGIKYALDHDFDAVALINNDVVLEPNWLEKITEATKKNNSSITTGLLLNKTGEKIDDAGLKFSSWGLADQISTGELPENAPESSFVFGATGAATLYKTELFKQIGFFDKSFFAYSEDTDISWRTQLAGHKVYYEKTAISYHKHSATSKKMPGFQITQVFQNTPLVLLKNIPSPQIYPIFIKFLLLYIAFLFQKVFKGQGSYALKGVKNALKLKKQALKDRKKIQKSRKIDNTYLKSLITKGLPDKQKSRLKLNKKESLHE
jgi:GT2 family glycosyltransferase